MPKYSVSYETDFKPSVYAVPAGAKVTEVSALPFKAEFGRYRDIEIKVELSALEDKAAFFYVKNKDRADSVGFSEWMSPETTRKLYEALKEIVGE